MKARDLWDLADIPTIQKKIITLINKDIERMYAKIQDGEGLNGNDQRALINYHAGFLHTNRDRRQESKKIAAAYENLSIEDAKAKLKEILGESDAPSNVELLEKLEMEGE